MSLQLGAGLIINALERYPRDRANFVLGVGSPPPRGDVICGPIDGAAERVVCCAVRTHENGWIIVAKFASSGPS